MASNVPARLLVVAGVLLSVLIASSCGGAIRNDAVRKPMLARPSDHGEWPELPRAPIGTRPYAVSGWSGSEAIFWAGSNLQRDFANTRGAAYHPPTDTWRELPVPGWGHPGLTGVVFDGRLYVAAKGGASRVDPTDGSATDLPHVQDFVLATVVATDDAVWGVGPTNYSDEEPVAVGIARYEPETDTWDPGPVFPGTPEMGSLFQDLLFLEQPVLWTGSEIIVWNHDGHGLSFDPKAALWRALPPLVAPRGTLRDSAVAVAGTRLIVLGEVERDGSVGYGVASWHGGRWAWHDTNIEATNFETVTIVGARDWFVVFSPDHPPHTVHVATGESLRHDTAPIDGVQAPNAVWTGSELVIWGGVPTRSDDNPNPAGGAVWIPPPADR